MNIALIRSRYDPYGGAERFVENAVAALAAQGAKLTVITRAWPGNANPNVEPLLIDPFYLGSVWRDKSFAQAVCAALDSRRFDLVQSHERIACCDVYRAGDGVHAEWLTQRKRVLSPVRKLGIWFNPHHRYLLQAERALFSSARLQAVICNSRMVKQEIVRHFNTPEHKLRLIYSAVDSAKFHPGLKDEHRSKTRNELRIPDGASVFLFVGSGFERKGLKTFLAALRALPKNCFGIAVGKDKNLPAYQALADRHGLGARLRFTGGVSDVRPYYGAADVFVLPSLYDPLPNACLEAMACGLPAVTSTKCGAAELLENGVNGFVCDAIQAEPLAAAMQACCARVETMGAAAREAVAPFTPARMAQEYLALYRSLLGAT